MTSNDVLDHFKQEKLTDTTEDVRKVLSYIGKPGKHQDIKREVIAKLFNKTSPQGFTTVDTIEGYEEF